MLPMIVAFCVPFVLLVWFLSATGHCFVATWHLGPVCGSEYWAGICMSPELAIFVLFMMSDPKTMPSGRSSRILYGAVVAALAILLISSQTTEFGVKLGLLSGLTVACCCTPLMQWVGSQRRIVVSPRAWLGRLEGLTSPAVVATAVLAFTVPSSVVSLAANPQLIAVESGKAGPGPSTQ
jgi:Na+-translocating ferredoxin:NAD+ oxidoreductase RnfD subunit